MNLVCYNFGGQECRKGRSVVAHILFFTITVGTPEQIDIIIIICSLSNLRTLGSVLRFEIDHINVYVEGNIMKCSKMPCSLHALNGQIPLSGIISYI